MCPAACAGDLEVPVSVLDSDHERVIRTAPIFTNTKNLWRSHLEQYEVSSIFINAQTCGGATWGKRR